MAKYLSNKFKSLKIGIDGFSDNLTSLEIVGKVGIGATLSLNSVTGIVSAVSFKKIGGTSSQFLMADGSTNTSTFLTSYTETDTLDNVLGRGNISGIGLSVGVVTSTSFRGDLIGNVTGNTSGNAGTATSLATARTIGGVSFDGTSSINLPGVNAVGNQNTTGNADTATTAGTVTTAAQPNITSVGTLASLTVQGNVSVGGTLTYEDVTNVDALGIVTARSGIHVGPISAGVATVTTDGSATFIGIITAASFVGDGSNLSNLPASGISDVVSDSSPQLGGNLDVNGKDITGTGNVNLTGIVTATTFSGSATSLTSIPAGNLTGTVADARISTLTASKLTGALPAISGANLTDVVTGTGNIDTSGTSTFNQLKVTGIATFQSNIGVAGSVTTDLLHVGYSTSIPLALGFDPSIQQVGTDNSSSTLGLYRFSADTAAPSIRFIKSRSSNPSSRGLVQFNDELGRINFIGDDGSDLANGGATISAHVDGVASASVDMPARLSFHTAPDGTAGGQERLTIKNDGLIGIGSVLPTQMLDVGGNIKGVSISAGSSITGTNLYGTLASGDVATSANSVVLGRVSGGAGSVEELTPAQIRTLLNVADGATAGSGIGNVVEDGTPELGGYLDLNNKGIFGVGVITATSFVGSGASLTALPPLTNSKSVLNPSYPQTGTFTVWLAARYNTTWDHYMIDSGNFGSGVSADRTGNISGADVDININVGDTLILDTATQATLNNAAGPTSIKTTPGTGSANRVSNPAATNNGTSSSNITWTPTVAGTYYYQNESRVNMRGQIIVSPTASPPASKFISDINFNSEGRVVGVVTFNGINAGSKATRGIIQIHDDPNLTVNTGIVSITQSLNLTGIVTAASFSGSGIGLTSLPAAQLTGSLPAINAANLTNLSSSQLTGALPAISGAALTGIQYTGITTISGQLNLNGMSKETINIVANKLSAATNIDLEDGLVHYFSTTETADATPNIRFNSSTTLNSKLSVGDSVTVTIISVTDNTNDSYEQLTIDGSAVTEQWLGGAPPGGGSSGYDVYTYQIIKTADATYLVFANKVNFT